MNESLEWLNTNERFVSIHNSRVGAFPNRIFKAMCTGLESAKPLNLIMIQYNVDNIGGDTQLS